MNVHLIQITHIIRYGLFVGLKLKAPLARVLKIDEVYGIYEGELRKNAHETFTALSLMINLSYKEKKFSEAEEYIELAK
ncbi:hypothetical protein LL037_13405 [Clostridium estertheticum]|uniref:Uncharacterized protein n=1 Tax=Clostridium estertheticum TaxID=238834 RepID=A0AA47I8S7_9CLOT|nr:hypothetical protein [Clostridium estertheticum]MBU3201461.1 hypothetical protein [Clostridium estertheticum]WAG62405.1 hypothetical protein LL038_09265 [Clostridium estertheticum]WAG63486.1 hypothetical protein LL037_13405 [Clostridium estertheticum]